MDAREALQVSRRRLEDELQWVTPQDFELATPCGDWTVRDLANHVVGVALRYSMLLQGATPADLAPSQTKDHIGNDALSAARQYEDDLEALIDATEISTVVHHPSGDVSAGDLVIMRVFEQTLHARDLAVALGHDPSLDPELCRFLLGHLELIEGSRKRGNYGERIESSSEDPNVRLLAETGRTP